MNEELEKEIEKKKKLISQFVKLSEDLGMKKEAREKRIDAMLDDLSKLLKKRD